MIAALALSGGDGGGQDPQAEATPDRTATPERTQTPEETATPEPEAEETATPEPTATEEAQEPQGEPNLAGARQLQLEGFNARQSGDFERALQLSEQAVEACGNSNELDPCGYALFEKGLALNRTDRPDEAIPVLEERLERFGDNDAGEVQKELDDAKKKAGG